MSLKTPFRLAWILARAWVKIIKVIISIAKRIARWMLKKILQQESDQNRRP